MKAIAIALAIFTAHYGYTVFGDGSRQANIDWFYSIGGFKSAFLFALIGYLLRASFIAVAVCAWGFAEEIQVGACQAIALSREKYPDVEIGQGVCGALSGWELSSISFALIVGAVALFIKGSKWQT